MTKLELTRLPLVKPLLRSRWPQLILRLIALAGFMLAILAGLLGTPVGSRNFAIVFVWIGWWALLMLLAIPLFGRGWCSICPIPLPGEWLQQGAILKPGGRGLGLNKRWPNKLRGIWLQNGAFLLVALFSTAVLTTPMISALVLLAFLGIAMLTSLVFERRAFCRYLCPVGGFIGLYSQTAPVELRVIDTAVCAAHTEKTCYTGNAEGYGCPWQVFPGGLTKNTYCGTCMECLRTCPHDNIAINLRAIGDDLEKPGGRKLDEAYKAFIMLGSALVYAAVLLGPWGALKQAAYQVGTLPWIIYVLTFLVLILAALPGLFWLAVTCGKAWAQKANPAWRSRLDTKRTFSALAYGLVPLGLAAWIAFSLSFVLTNLSYIWPSLSDPFGWGWNLFGSAALDWTPYLTRTIPYLQAGVMLAGLAWSGRVILTIAHQQFESRGDRASESGLQKLSKRLAIPALGYSMLVTLGILGLLLA